jgi:hypothetical protein
MKKFQITGSFFMDNNFMEIVPQHRIYINSLIENSVIEHYLVSMETRQTWITINAASKNDVQAILNDMPLANYMNYSIAEIFVFDGANYRPAAYVLN